MDDLSKPIDEFLKSGKQLFVFNPSTGRGKSYGVRQEIKRLVDESRIKNKFFYITDRTANIEEQYKELQARGVDCLWLKSYTDSVFDNISIVEKLGKKKPFKGSKELDRVVRACSYYKKTKENNYSERDRGEAYDDFEDAEREFRRSVRRKLDDIYNRKKKDEDDNSDVLVKLEMIENNSDIKDILRIYPGMQYCRHKVILLTSQKLIRVFDPIISKRFFLYEKGIDESIYFFDESDAVKQSMINDMSKDAVKNEIDLISILRMYKYGMKEYLQGYYPAEFGETDIGKAEKILAGLGKLDENGLSNSIKIVGSERQFMYVDTNHTVLTGDRETSLFINRDDKNSYIVEPDDKGGYNLLTFATEAERCFRDANLIFLKMATEYDKERHKKCHKEHHKEQDIYSSILAVMNMLGLDRLDNRDTRDTLQKCIYEYAFTGKIEDYHDYYMYPGKYIKAEMPFPEAVKMTLGMQQLMSTPEKILRKIIRRKGQIILSSATAGIRSASSNFDLDWKYLAEARYEMDEATRNDYEEYCAARDKYDNRFDVKVSCKAHNCGLDNLIKNMHTAGELDDRSYEILKLDIEERKGNKDQAWRNRRMLEAALFIHDFCTLGGHVALVFMPHNMDKAADNGKDKEIEILKKYIKLIGTDEDSYIMEIMLSKNIDSVRDNLKKYKDDKPLIVVTTYASASKGLNLQYGTVSVDDVVAINEASEAKLGMRKKKEKIIVDFDGIYLGEPTNLFAGNLLTESYYIESMSASDGAEMTDKDRQESLEKLIKYGASGSDDDSDGNKKWAAGLYQRCPRNYIGAMMSKIIQAVGRISRTGFKRKNVYIGLSVEMMKKFIGLDVSQLRYDIIGNDFKCMPKELREMVQYVFGGNNAVIQSSNIFGINEFAINITKHAMEEMAEGNPAEYKHIRQSLNRLVITREEYSALDDFIKFFYIPIEDFMKRGYSVIGYSYDVQTDGDENHVDAVYPKSRGRCNVDEDTFCIEGLIENGKKDMLCGIDASFNMYNPEHILCPKGIELMKGNLGEAIGSSILQEYIGIELKELDDKVYETVDNVFFKNGTMFCIDFKFYGRREYGSKFDRMEPHVWACEEKLRKLEAHYGMKGILFVINAKPFETNEDADRIVNEIVDGRIYTVPYMVCMDGKPVRKVVKKIKALMEAYAG